MGKYKIGLSDQAKGHLAEWSISGQSIALRKIERIIKELAETPISGIGSPEKLKYQLTEYWSRKIDKKNRIIYQVNDENNTIIIISAKGHYRDK